MTNTKKWSKLIFVIFTLLTAVFEVLNKFSTISLEVQIVFFLLFGITVFISSRIMLPSYLFFVVIFETGIQSGYIGASPNYIFALLVTLSLLSLFRYNLKIKNIASNSSLYLVIFFIYYIPVSLIMIQSSIQTDFFNGHWKMIFSAILLTYLIYKIEYMDFIEFTIIYSSVILTFYVLLLVIFGFDIASIESKISTIGQLPDRNYMSLVLSYGAVLSFGKFINIDKRKWLYTITFIIIIIGQVFLASRGGIITTAVGLLYFISIKKGFATKIKYLALIVMLSFLSIFFQENAYLFSRFKDKENLNSMSGRTEIWNEGISNFGKQDIVLKLFGGGYHHAIENLTNKRSVHNNYLETLFDYGIIGLAIMLIFFIKAYKYGDIYQHVLIITTAVGCISLSPWMSLFFWLFIAYFTINKKKLSAFRA